MEESKMKFIAQKIGNRIQIKTYKQEECTKVTFLKYHKAFNTLEKLEKQGHTVKYRQKGAIKSLY